jgi:hypothetical protein
MSASGRYLRYRTECINGGGFTDCQYRCQSQFEVRVTTETRFISTDPGSCACSVLVFRETEPPYVYVIDDVRRTTFTFTEIGATAVFNGANGATCTQNYNKEYQEPTTPPVQTAAPIQPPASSQTATQQSQELPGSGNQPQSTSLSDSPSGGPTRTVDDNSSVTLAIAGTVSGSVTSLPGGSSASGSISVPDVTYTVIGAQIALIILVLQALKVL